MTGRVALVAQRRSRGLDPRERGPGRALDGLSDPACRAVRRLRVLLFSLLRELSVALGNEGHGMPTQSGQSWAPPASAAPAPASVGADGTHTSDVGSQAPASAQ